MKEGGGSARTSERDAMDASGIQSDVEVVQATLAHKDSFGELVIRYEEKFRRYIRRLGIRNEEDQDDVLQEIFIKIYRNLNGYDQSLSFSSWAYRIAHNEAVSHHRKRTVRPEGHAIDDGDEVIALSGSGDDLMEELAAKDDGRLLGEALNRLDPKYRDVIVLRYFEGKEYEEIADILLMPVGSVATRIFRAKAALRGLLARTLTV
jgi:RNA polymerase sigma-70 factor, ECF subfamily